MVGPSSSHTAGAVRIGLVARRLLGEEPVRAELLLHGSFADTGRGHGTDRALIAGLLGMEPDDSRIPDSFDHAAEHGLKFEFGTCTLREAHPNSVLLLRDGRQRKARRGRRRVDRRRADTDTAIKRYAAVLLRRAADADSQ